MRKLLVRVLAATAALALAWSLVVWLTGGLDFTIAGLHVTSTNISRLLVAGLAAAVVALLVNGFRSTVEDVKTTAARVTPFSVAVALAATTTVLSLLASSWTASGPDSYAYLSHAAMLREGRLSVPIDLADEAPWPGAPGTFVPFGYHLTASRPSALVPVTAPGLPMLMAALQLVAGHCAAFLVTPVAGGALVWLTFLIGRRVRSPAAGLIAAWLVATSPAVLFMLMWPMSDIPGAAWTALVLLWLIPGGFAPADPPTPASAFGFGEASPKRKAEARPRRSALRAKAGAHSRGPLMPRSRLRSSSYGEARRSAFGAKAAVRAGSLACARSLPFPPGTSLRSAQGLPHQQVF